MKLLILTMLLPMFLPIVIFADGYYYYEGFINNKIPIRMFLDKRSSPLETSVYYKKVGPVTKTLWHYSGFYYYLKYKSPIAIIGNRDGNTLHLEEHEGGSICTNCIPAAFFDGVQKNDTISGIWMTVDSARSLPFRVVKKRLNKRIIFGWLLGGMWELDGGEGFYGANTMTSFQREKGGWSSGGSSIVQSMRTGFESSLTKEEQRTMDRIRLTVTESMEIRVTAGSLEMLSIPYTEKPFVQLDAITIKEDRYNPIEKYLEQEKPASLLDLNIATTDRAAFEEVLTMEVTPFRRPYVAHVEYSVRGDGFLIHLMSMESADQTELWFSRVKK